MIYSNCELRITDAVKSFARSGTLNSIPRLNKQTSNPFSWLSVEEMIYSRLDWIIECGGSGFVLNRRKMWVRREWCGCRLCEWCRLWPCEWCEWCDRCWCEWCWCRGWSFLSSTSPRPPPFPRSLSLSSKSSSRMKSFAMNVTNIWMVIITTRAT